MSVPKRNRKPSRMEFLVLCDEVRADTTRVLINRRLVEPKWKYTVAVPGIQMAQQICWYIKAANYIFPKDETALATRRELQYKALGACAGLADHFRYCLETLCETDLNGSPKNLVERFGKICEKINKLVDVLKGWKASDTVRTPKE